MGVGNHKFLLLFMKLSMIIFITLDDTFHFSSSSSCCISLLSILRLPTYGHWFVFCCKSNSKYPCVAKQTNQRVQLLVSFCCKSNLHFNEAIGFLLLHLNPLRSKLFLCWWFLVANWTHLGPQPIFLLVFSFCWFSCIASFDIFFSLLIKPET